METWEMIKKLTKNPKRKFEMIGGIDGQYVTIVGDHIMWNNNIPFVVEHIMTRKWREIDESVPFTKAIKALDNGKTIYVLHGEDYEHKEVFSPRGNKVDGGVALFQDQDYAIWTGLILYGKWYIED